VTRWLDAFPQYRVGHLERVASMEAALRRDLPGVEVVGAAYRGLGITTCIAQGRGAARRVLASIVAGQAPDPAPRDADETRSSDELDFEDLDYVDTEYANTGVPAPRGSAWAAVEPGHTEPGEPGEPGEPTQMMMTSWPTPPAPADEPQPHERQPHEHDES